MYTFLKAGIRDKGSQREIHTLTLILYSTDIYVIIRLLIGPRHNHTR